MCADRRGPQVAFWELGQTASSRLTTHPVTISDGLPEDHWDTHPAQISAVTAEDVQRAAKRYLNLDTVRSVAVGDAVKIKPVLEKYGKVTVYDAAGKVM